MAAESPLLGQLQHIPFSSTIRLSSEPHPPFNADPLQGLVQEMALSAAIQKHGSTVPHSTHANNGAIIKNYVVPTQANGPISLVAPSTADAAPLQSAGLVQLGGATGNMQQGFITLSGAQPSGNVSLLAHPQASPVLQGSSLALPQLTGLHEMGTNAAAAAANMVQFTPVCTGSAQPSPMMERSQMMQSSFVG